MTCHEIENYILDYEEGRLPSANREAVGKHIAGCDHCRTLATQLKQLDTALTQKLKAPALSAAFKARLQQRIQTDVVVLSPAQIAERKRQLQAEYELGLARLSPFAFLSRRLLQSLSYVALLTIVGLLVWQCLPQLADAVAKTGLDLPGQEFLPLIMMSVLFVVMGLIAAFPQKLERLRVMAFAR